MLRSPLRPALRLGPTLAAAFVLAIAALPSCRSGGGGDSPPAIMVGESVCATCGMTVEEPRFAAAARGADGIKLFDSIECLLRDVRRGGGSIPEATWLADYEAETLFPSSSMTVVAADFPSPMGEGFAAFHDPAKAAEAASSRNGVAGSLADFASGKLAPPPR